MINFNGVTFTSWNTNVSKHSYTDFGVILTEQNMELAFKRLSKGRYLGVKYDF